MNIDLLPWILVVQIWSDPPPKIQLVYRKELPDYSTCMQARKEWEEKNWLHYVVQRQLFSECGI